MARKQRTAKKEALNHMLRVDSLTPRNSGPNESWIRQYQPENCSNQLLNPASSLPRDDHDFHAATRLAAGIHLSSIRISFRDPSCPPGSLPCTALELLVLLHLMLQQAIHLMSHLQRKLAQCRLTCKQMCIKISTTASIPPGVG